ncbi:MAG: UDP-N-acetylglucosamine 1-carboxyvinyltransferase [Bacilli bacterium]|nr:UDP-N-acetylglucosamine 1-carboxyvinyltransferase [Bacilli bacterium]
MSKIQIKGGNNLSGTIRIGGAKNSAVALIPAAILCDSKVTICNVPDITDTEALEEILKYLGANISRASESIIIDSSTIENKEIPEGISKKLRASYYFMGALLGRYKQVEMHFPGGCSIGARPIDLHLKGFEALGATVEEDGNKYKVYVKDKVLKGANIFLDIASVGATINIMLAAVYAKGVTTIENAAKEPEIVNVATFLNQMGANIKGAGTNTIKIKGVTELTGCFHEVIPDRIEAGTYLIAGAMCGKYLKIDNIIPEHLELVISKLSEMGVEMEVGTDYVIVNAPKEYKPTHIRTAVYPGFPTDLQQPFMALLTQANGKSIVEEKIWENRFMHVPYLNKMGAKIEMCGDKATVEGKTELTGCEVIATDLRAGAAMVVAGLLAKNTTTIDNVEHILRGYEDIIDKLNNVGAEIKFID